MIKTHIRKTPRDNNWESFDNHGKLKNNGSWEKHIRKATEHRWSLTSKNIETMR